MDSAHELAFSQSAGNQILPVAQGLHADCNQGLPKTLPSFPMVLLRGTDEPGHELVIYMRVLSVSISRDLLALRGGETGMTLSNLASR